jgi:Zn-finger nucleic acid-binding protein
MPDEPVSVVCPQCSVKLKLKDSSALGTRIKCPKCQTAFIAAATPSPAVAAAAGSAPAGKKRPPADAPPEDEGDDEESAQPKKKKKKKKKKKQQSGAPMGLIIGISAFVFLLVAGGVVAMVVMAKGGGGGSRGATIEAPELAEASGQAFSILAPKGWTTETGGHEQTTWMDFTNGPIKVKARDDSTGVGDLISGPNRGERHEDHTLDTVHGVHLGKGETLKEEFDNYSELEPVKFDAKVGNGRWSEYSYTEGWLFSTKMKGIRATVQNNTKTFVIRCSCPEKYWETFRPIFIQIATSVGPGRRA